MGTLVSYALDGGIATIGLDDGKVNVLSPALLGELNAALDKAEAERAVVVLTGREGVFSAGFDLGVLRAGGSDALGMVHAGFELALRVLSFPTPVIIACPGHAIAMGVFLLLSGDYRIGAAGPYRLMANEVALGLPMPRAAVEIMRQRLTPACFNRALLLAEHFSPDNAVDAGFLDRVVEPAELPHAARSTAEAMLGLNLDAHAASKLRAREPVLRALRAAIDTDYAAVTS
jgi:enoyl-CoA hydratase